MASVAYAIEGPKETLKRIQAVIIKAINDKDNRYEEYKACEYLGFDIIELEKSRLGGEISDEPTWDKKTGALRFWTEERWGLQDFNDLLESHFLGIKVYWVVEESGCEVYATNDKEGKYFKERFYVDCCIDGMYYSEYFTYKSDAFKWLFDKTNGRVNTDEKVEEFNADYEDSGAADENFIYIHEFDVID